MPSFAGAVILPKYKKTLLFKNRDMAIQDHRDEIFYDVDCFGIRGVNNTTGAIGGLAIGVNRNGLAIANTHVRNTEDPSYHILTEQLLMFTKDAEDGLSMTVDHLQSGRKYQWGNLILADNDSMLGLELAGNDHSIEWSERRVLRTSHHIMLDTEETLRSGGDSYDQSVQRVERGYDLIRQVKTVDDVFAMLKDHGEKTGPTSLCCHPGDFSEAKTTMSYVIEVDYNTESGKPKIIFHVANGSSCESGYTAIPIIFPADDEIMNRAKQLYPFG
ncbi:MAG: C45 family peptidase [Candidatus Thorarchaeota archaeon]|nr:C45 family peptidase [Candidatus Thorarchaeota archaeon]